MWLDDLYECSLMYPLGALVWSTSTSTTRFLFLDSNTPASKGAYQECCFSSEEKSLTLCRITLQTGLQSVVLWGSAFDVSSRTVDGFHDQKRGPIMLWRPRDECPREE